MKIKKYIFTLLILGCMLGITGCGKTVKDNSKDEEKDRTPATKTEATAEPTEAPTPEPTEAPTPEPTKEPAPEPTEEPVKLEPTEEITPKLTGDTEDDPIILSPNINEIFDLFVEGANEADEPELVAELNKATGYICSDADTFNELLEVCDLNVEWMTYENIDNEPSSSFFYFEMTHEYPAMEVPSDDDVTYITEYTSDDEIYYVMFGAKENSSDIEILTEEGITIEYWSFAVERDGNYMVIPFFAGNEDTGYYVVRTNCEVLDIDVSETMTLAEQNISFANGSTDIPDEPNPYTPEPNQPLPALTSDEFSFEITGVVSEEGLAALYCELGNGYDKEVYLDNEIIILNGEDITDNTLFTFWVEGNSSIQEESFSIVDYTLASGDTLQISFTVVDYETDTLLGTVEYSYTIS